MIGLVVAILVLLVAFGSVIAMGIPIGTALFGIFVGIAGITMLAAFMDVPEFSLILCAMIGLGVGIDYALFIVTRHRQHLQEGMSVEDAAGTANATAGQAVLFAGTTVVIAILGLYLAGLPAISAMGAAVALVVTVSMVAAVTLLPGLLGLAGTKIDRLKIPRKTHVAKPADETVSGRWAHHVGSHPVRYAVTRPRRAGRPRHPGAEHAHRRRRRRQRPRRTPPSASPTTSWPTGFGPGFNGPLQVVVDVPHRSRPGRRRPRPRRPAADPGHRRGHRSGRSTPPATPPCSPPTRPRPRRTRTPTSWSTTCGPTSCRPRWRAPRPRCR